MIVFNYNSIDRWWVEWQNYGGGHFRLNLWYHVQIFLIMADLFTSQIITKKIYLPPWFVLLDSPTPPQVVWKDYVHF